MAHHPWVAPSMRAACAPDFSVVLFRPDFMLASEKYPMKAHKNQQLLAMLCSPDSLMEPGARGQTIVPEVQKPSQWPCMRRLLREVCSQLMREKHFHGVSSASPHAYSLKSRYGKVSPVRIGTIHNICQVQKPGKKFSPKTAFLDTLDRCRCFTCATFL